MRKDYVHRVTFWRSGIVPSKANYRHGGTNSREEWAKIKFFEADMRKHAMVYGGYMRSDCVVEVRVGLLNQRVDADNANKAILDSLQEVYFKDDSKRNLRRVSIEHFPDEPGEEPGLKIDVRWFKRD